MSRYQPILIHKNISIYLWDDDIHTLQDGWKYCGIFQIYETLAIFLKKNHQDTESESQEIEIGVDIHILPKKIKGYMG